MTFTKLPLTIIYFGYFGFVLGHTVNNTSSAHLRKRVFVCALALQLFNMLELSTYDLNLFSRKMNVCHTCTFTHSFVATYLYFECACGRASRRPVELSIGSNEQVERWTIDRSIYRDIDRMILFLCGCMIRSKCMLARSVQSTSGKRTNIE